MRCPGRPRGAPCRCAPLRAAGSPLRRFPFPRSAFLLLAVWGVPSSVPSSCTPPPLFPPPWVVSGCPRAGLAPSPAAERTRGPRGGAGCAGPGGAVRECRRREPVPQSPFPPLSPPRSAASPAEGPPGGLGRSGGRKVRGFPRCGAGAAAEGGGGGGGERTDVRGELRRAAPRRLDCGRGNICW